MSLTYPNLPQVNDNVLLKNIGTYHQSGIIFLPFVLLLSYIVHLYML